MTASFEIGAFLERIAPAIAERIRKPLVVIQGAGRSEPEQVTADAGQGLTGRPEACS